MGLFRKREKEYTLREAMKILAKEGHELDMPIPVNPGDDNTKYWIRKSENTFEDKRNKFMDEISNNGEYRKLPNDINTSHSTKPGRVVKYNDYQRQDVQVR